MGIQLNGSTRGRHRRTYRPNTDINVTPMVDVMLVLLVVFMVTAPLLTVGVAVDLPKAEAPNLAAEKEPLYVSIRKDGRVFIQEQEVSLDDLMTKLHAITKDNPDARILVRGDQAINYGRILEVMGRISAAGFKKVGLIAQLPDGSS